MRRAAIAMLALNGCLIRNPGFDEQATGGAATTEIAGATTRDASTGPAIPTSTADATAVADASTTTGPTTDPLTGDGTGTSTAADVTEGTGAADTEQPVGPELCHTPVGSWSFGEVGPVPFPISDGAYDDDPWLTADGRDLLFSSDRDGGGFDSFRAQRDDLGAPFEQVVSNDDANINSSATESKVAVTADELVGALASNRATGRLQIFVAARPGPLSPFEDFVPQPLDLPPNTDAFDPHLSQDGLRLYFTPQTDGQPKRFALARRDDLGQPFAAVEDGLFSAIHVLPGEVLDLTLSADERVLVFSYRSPGAPDHDLYYATRVDVGLPFAAPLPLPGLSEDDFDELGPHLRGDGCELFFVGRPTQDLKREIYVAKFQ